MNYKTSKACISFLIFSESIHARHIKTWRFYDVPEDHPKFPDQLYLSTLKHNSKVGNLVIHI